MSNFLAIATVTATMQTLLQAAIGVDVAGATATTVRPDGSDNGLPPRGLNIYLYQVTPNGAWRNSDLPHTFQRWATGAATPASRSTCTICSPFTAQRTRWNHSVFWAVPAHTPRPAAVNSGADPGHTASRCQQRPEPLPARL